MDLARINAYPQATYRNAEPFPHAVFRGVFDDALLDAVAAEFPDPDRMGQQYQAPDEFKSAENRWEHFGPATQRLLVDLNSAPFVTALERLTGFTGLITDHEFRGGGQHQTRHGGHLGIHADFNIHRTLGLVRRLNVLVFLNRDWRDEWGGHLELWDTDMTRAVVRVAPEFNTMVLFTTSSNSFHGHPDPLNTPDGTTRRSVATYYYTSPVAPEEVEAHTTLFKDRPDAEVRSTDRQKAMRWFRSGTRDFMEGARLMLPVSMRSRIDSRRKH
jgi:hypothetical protein